MGVAGRPAVGSRGSRPLLLLMVLGGCCLAGSLSIGGFSLDFSGGKDLTPQQYRNYIKSRTPETPRLNLPSPLWYIYSDDPSWPSYKAQMAEIKAVEAQLGVKFWKIRVKNAGTYNLLKNLWMATMPPNRRGRSPENRRQVPRYLENPQAPFFYNMFTGVGAEGELSAPNIKKLALGKPFHRGPFQDFDTPGFNEVAEEVAAEEEKRIIAENPFPEDYLVKRYQKDRDAALRVHRRQYARRKFLSKLRLAKPLPPNEYWVDISADQAGKVAQSLRPPRGPSKKGKGGDGWLKKKREERKKGGKR